MKLALIAAGLGLEAAVPLARIARRGSPEQDRSTHGPHSTTLTTARIVAIREGSSLRPRAVPAIHPRRRLLVVGPQALRLRAGRRSSD